MALSDFRQLPPDELWSLMQRIERLRHRAELFEEEAPDQPAELRDEMLKAAIECRTLAAQLEQEARTRRR